MFAFIIPDRLLCRVRLRTGYPTVRHICSLRPFASPGSRLCVYVCVCGIIPLYCWPKAVQVVCRLSDLGLNVLMSVGVCVRVNVVSSVQHPPV